MLNGPLKGSELAEVFDRVRTLVQIGSVGLPDVPGSQLRHRHSLPAPIFSPRGRIIGFMAFELENEQVFRVFKDSAG